MTKPLSPKEFPILEFDPAGRAIIEPSDLYSDLDVPEHCVLCFFREAIGDAVANGGGELLREIPYEGSVHQIFQVERNGHKIAVIHPGVGAPLAGAALDMMIGFGCRKFIACGGAGALDKDLALGQILLPEIAVRDEGMSYHYAPPSREISVNAQALAAVEKVLKNADVPFQRCKTWTTDAFFRETVEKVALRRREGCLVVEMEASAFFAVAEFRGVKFAQMLYAGDVVKADGWDGRDWTKRSDVRRNLLELSLQACLEIK